MHTNATAMTGPDGASLQHDRCGILYPMRRQGRLNGTARFITADGEQRVSCVIAVPNNLRWKVWRVRADILPMPNGDLIAIAARNDLQIDPLVCTPEHFCPVPGTVKALRALADSIQHPPLRKFLSDVFADSRVFEDYWTARGGPDHHHWEGGLAVHALEVAQSVAEAFKSPPAAGEAWAREERDLALVTALIHDIGECFDDGAPLADRFEVSRRIMELRHMALIHDPLSALHNTSRSIARALIVLLFPRQQFARSTFRTGAMRERLVAAHAASIARGTKPASPPSVGEIGALSDGDRR